MRSIKVISLSIVAGLCLIFGCGGGGGGTSTPTPTIQAPTGLTYSSNPAIYTSGVAISPNSPSSGGGVVASYGVSPALPTGLSMNTSTGVIMGTPTAVTASNSYTVTATNAGGSTTASLNITVNSAIQPPTGLTYSSNPATYTKGMAITPNSPSHTGGVVTGYSVSPSLPSGLTLSATTGVISGTPTAISSSGTYTVTASNAGGATSASLSIAVTDLAPSISYGNGSYAFIINVPISTLIPSNTGGAAISWAISPALPNGLLFDTASGSISGTPSTITAPTSFTITATNTGGSCMVSPIIRVNPPAPTISSQPGNVSIIAGQSATFSVSASGTGGLGYQWLKNGSVISGANVASYTTPVTVQADNGALFSVVVSDTYGQSVTSSTATMAVSASGFASTGSMTTARWAFTSTLLQNGKVLITGGCDASGIPLASAELYDPATGTFTITGPMGTARYYHTATILSNGKVLIVGGSNANGSTILASAELYDPTSGTFAATGTMNTERWFHSATALNNGKVLIAGGTSNAGNLMSAELYDPTTGTFTFAGFMSSYRAAFNAILLQSGKVLLAGGAYGTAPLRSADIYDPAAGTFTPTGSMNTGRAFCTASLLPNGKVLFAGGPSSTIPSAELYDPALGTFSATTGSMVTLRWFHTASVLPNGKVLIAGGNNNATGNLASAELFDPATGAFTATESMGVARHGHAATLMSNGFVLIVGGTTPIGGTAEIYFSY